MPYTYDEEIFSDLFKDAYGFRPRGHEFYTATPEEKQKIWDNLLVTLKEEVEREKQEQALAVESYKKLIKETIAMGATNVEQAIDWLMQSEGAEKDESYFKYLMNLPYEYNLREVL